MNPQYIIELFNNKQHETTNFNCGVKILNIYLQEKVSQEIRKKITVAYIARAINSSRVIGYYTLSSSSIELRNLPEHIIKKLPKYKAIPVILIGRLAVDKNYQGKKMGKHLLHDALVRAYRLSNQIGSFAVIVDAKNENSKNFYEKYGFIQFINQPFKLYLPIGTIKNLITR